MDIFRRIFFVAVLAGTLAGLAAGAIQQWRVVPLILEAELYEISEEHAPDHAADPAPVAPHAHGGEEGGAWAPADGLERTFYTMLTTLLSGLGFALILAAVSLLSGIGITLANSVLWGLAGFLSFSLMPAIGLPPELPGMEAADLGARQLWWSATVILTGAGILTFARLANPAGLGIGLALLLVPHIWGAPPPPDVPSSVPAHLATAFAANALFSSLAFWLMLAALYGWRNQKTLTPEPS